MVSPKYERLNTGDGDVDAGSDADGDKVEEVELKLELSHKNSRVSQERRQLPTHASNFKYAKSGSGSGNNNSDSGSGSGSGSGATSASHQHHQHDGMTRHTDARFMQMAICTIVIVLLYLTLSITLTFYQTDVIRDLPIPLTIVTYHLVLKFMLAASLRSIYKMQMGKSRVQLDWRVAVRKMAPTGIASGIDIGFSNWGLLLVPISLYTMTKSSTIVFILLFAIMLGLERKVSGVYNIIKKYSTLLFL